MIAREKPLWEGALFLVVIGLLFLFLHPANLNAEDTSQAAPQTGTDKVKDKAKFHKFLEEYVKGSLEYKSFGYFHKAKQDSNMFSNEAILKFDAKYELGEKNSIVLKPVLRADDRHFTSAIVDDVQETDARRYYLNFKEAYFATRSKQLDLYLGKRIYSWGKAEGFNPTDDINPYDFLDFPDKEKIGVFSAAVEYSFGDYSLDAVYIPFFTPARMPERNNRWAGNIGDDLTATTGGLPALPSAELEARQLPPNTLGNSQVASRLKTTLKGWDFALTFYHGFDPIPSPAKETRNLIDYYIPKFNRINEYGFSAATTWDKLEAHAETSYRDTLSGNDDDFLAYIAGGSYSWDELGVDFLEKISLYLEYAGEEVINEKDNPKRYSSKAYSRPFQKSVLGSLNIKFNEDVEFAFGGNYNFDEFDRYMQPKLTYKFSDKLKLRAGMDILTGHKDTFWGKWRKNDRVFANLTWYF